MSFKLIAIFVILSISAARVTDRRDSALVVLDHATGSSPVLDKLAVYAVAGLIRNASLALQAFYPCLLEKRRLEGEIATLNENIEQLEQLLDGKELLVRRCQSCQQCELARCLDHMDRVCLLDVAGDNYVQDYPDSARGPKMIQSEKPEQAKLLGSSHETMFAVKSDGNIHISKVQWENSQPIQQIAELENTVLNSDDTFWASLLHGLPDFDLDLDADSFAEFMRTTVDDGRALLSDISRDMTPEDQDYLFDYLQQSIIDEFEDLSEDLDDINDEIDYFLQDVDLYGTAGTYVRETETRILTKSEDTHIYIDRARNVAELPSLESVQAEMILDAKSAAESAKGTADAAKEKLVNLKFRSRRAIQETECSQYIRDKTLYCVDHPQPLNPGGGGEEGECGCHNEHKCRRVLDKVARWEALLEEKRAAVDSLEREISSVKREHGWVYNLINSMKFGKQGADANKLNITRIQFDPHNVHEQSHWLFIDCVITYTLTRQLPKRADDPPRSVRLEAPFNVFHTHDYHVAQPLVDAIIRASFTQTTL